jgi:hypothetical protein
MKFFTSGIREILMFLKLPHIKREFNNKFSFYIVNKMWIQVALIQWEIEIVSKWRAHLYTSWTDTSFSFPLFVSDTN